MATTLPGTTSAGPSRAQEKNAPEPGGRRRSGWGLTVLIVLASLAVLLPLYFTVAMALKSSEEAATGSGFSWPWPMRFDNFATAWEMTAFPRAFAISLAVTVATVAGLVTLASCAAYAIARNWERKLFRWSYFYLLAAMFIPFPVIALPQIKLVSIVNLDNPAGVAILHILFGLSFNVLLYTAFLRSIPYELEESARLDGASTWQVFWRLIFPLLAPMNATVGIFAFLASWNDFMMPSLITSDPAMQTIPVVQSIFQSQFSANYNVAFASYLMAMAPTVLAYLFAQRWVMTGVTRGAIK
ncbi:carbohydrate ABC transporter permease [Jidongwangia harbinensis]|uniref:carbohydrate ABC transporter permease n=1 Tax=Jidongwangia harbinensis TaxID=2878561 RepID=UPI001CD96985|nr:carbohydrate ABC transporter permease [Jidongwangia harbinensis]MCA2214150.1 carbohydrate ABC transporter permease [Jidongwangia harbinensis]